MLKHWTKEEALPVLHKAYKDGILSAQNGGRCLYRSDGHPCALGVLIDDETANLWDHGDKNGVFVGQIDQHPNHPGVVAVFGGPDFQWFATLQKLHDNWADLASNDKFDERLAEYEKQFKLMLDLV